VKEPIGLRKLNNVIFKKPRREDWPIVEVWRDSDNYDNHYEFYRPGCEYRCSKLDNQGNTTGWTQWQIITIEEADKSFPHLKIEQMIEEVKKSFSCIKTIQITDLLA
jgi:hypothetical protein